MVSLWEQRGKIDWLLAGEAWCHEVGLNLAGWAHPPVRVVCQMCCTKLNACVVQLGGRTSLRLATEYVPGPRGTQVHMCNLDPAIGVRRNSGCLESECANRVKVSSSTYVGQLQIRFNGKDFGPFWARMPLYY